MSINNIERMVDALVRDEVNYYHTLNRSELIETLSDLVREKYESMDNDFIIEEYERLA